MPSSVDIFEVGNELNIMPTPLGFTIHIVDDNCVGISLDRDTLKYRIIHYSYDTNKLIWNSDPIESYQEAKEQLKEFVEKHFSKNIYINFLTLI